MAPSMAPPVRPAAPPSPGMGSGGMAPRPASPMGGTTPSSAPRPMTPGSAPGSSPSPQPYRPSWARDDDDM
jgi:hypothetical protein